MNKLAKSALAKGRRLSFSREGGDIGEYKTPYPIIEVKRLTYKGEAYRRDEYPHVEMDVEADVVLEDSYDGVRFLSTIAFFDEADILEEEDEIGEGYILPGPTIDLDDLALRMLHSLLPMKILRPGSQLPEGVEQVDAGEEGEAGPSPFDILEDKI